MPYKSDPVDWRIAEIAERQHGAISLRQLHGAGLSRDAVLTRVRSGRLHRLHRGVYAVGHRAPSLEREWMAAVLACGQGAVLSHASAAALWDLLPARDGLVDVTTRSRNGRKKRKHIRLHRCATLIEGTIARRRGIPVTTPARTVADLKGAVPEWQWRKAVRQAEFKRFDLGRAVETDGTRSDLERDFLRLCRRSGLPPPEVNVKIGGWTVDFLWREQRVAVETDFYEYHRGKIAFQDDHARDLALRRHGLDVRRYSEEQLNERPEEILADLRAALAAPRPGSSAPAPLIE